MHASCQSHVPGVPGTASVLAHTPVFVAQGDADQVIPHESLDDTWTYLLTESGAPVGAHRDPCGHGITLTTLHRLAGWLDARLNYLAVNAGTPDADAAGTYWASLTDGVLPRRSGPRPEVSWAIPQQQLSDNAPVAIRSCCSPGSLLCMTSSRPRPDLRAANSGINPS